MASTKRTSSARCAAPDPKSPDYAAQFNALLDRLKQIVVSVDPSGCMGEEDKRSDEIGIVVCGKGFDGCGYVLEDLSGHYSPEGWAKAAVGAYDNGELTRSLAKQTMVETWCAEPSTLSVAMFLIARLPPHEENT
jgi:hypothetical protein